MELRHLRYFVALGEELNFTRAAERLHIAQPPLSQQIRQLEDELGVTLLQRNSRPIRLTEAGELFLARARALLANFESAVADTRKTAISRIDPDSLNQLLAPVFDPQAKAEAVKGGKLLAKGLNAGPGAACGATVFNPERAMELAKEGKKSVLVRIETSPEDIHGMNAAEGILTSRGGMTSHAALVARGMGKPCVVGCTALNINDGTGVMEVNGRTIREGDYISIDGTTGEVIEGQLSTSSSEIIQVLIEKKIRPEDSPIYRQFGKLMAWADEIRKMDRVAGWFR